MLISCHFNPGFCQWNLIGCCLPNVFDDKEMPNFLAGKISIAVGELTHSACFNPPIMQKKHKKHPVLKSRQFFLMIRGHLLQFPCSSFNTVHNPSIFVLVWYALIMLSSCFNSCEWTPTYLLIIFNNASFFGPRFMNNTNRINKLKRLHEVPSQPLLILASWTRYSPSTWHNVFTLRCHQTWLEHLKMEDFPSHVWQHRRVNTLTFRSSRKKPPGSSLKWATRSSPTMTGKDISGPWWLWRWF